MHIFRIQYDNINVFSKGFSVDFVATDRVVDANNVTHIFKHVFCQKVIGFVGINATGKTVALKLINMAMDIVLDNKGLDNVEIPVGIIKDQSTLTVIFEQDDFIYKLVSRIRSGKINEQSGISASTHFFFADESVFKKRKQDILSKSSVFSFVQNEVFLSRKEITESEATFLKPQDSIISKVTKEQIMPHIDMIFSTNLNVFLPDGLAQSVFVNLFDSSIKSINVDKKKISISYKNIEQSVETDNLLQIADVLSSGTIKGISLLSKATVILKHGGYLIVDEIENHIHKKLVQTIISFFVDPAINSKGATLIFTTHYTEILDSIDRKDNI